MGLQTVAAGFRAELLKRDQTAANAMVRAYGGGWRSINVELQKVLRRIEDARLAGEIIQPGAILSELRLRSLLSQAEREINLFAKLASARVQREQRQAIDAARRHAEALVIEQLPSGLEVTFAQLPKKALHEMVGLFADGSPLNDTFDSFGAGARRIIKDELTAGLISGRGVRVIANRIRDSLGGQLSRALTISRTEVLRAYREASVQTYQANNDVVKGWRWAASLSSRTCPMCLSMDGSIHPVSESFASHPHCRCSPVPETKSWRELGIPIDEPERTWQSGEDWFSRQSDAMQRDIFGPAAFKAYQSGSVTLSDFVGEKQSLRWGKTRYTRSLTEILGNQAERFKRAA